jgi:hypothetical protein
MTDTSRIQRWRDGKRKDGLKAVTVWLTTEDERRLKDLATTWHCSPSTLVQHALAAYHPGVPQPLSTEGGPEAAPPQVDVWGLLAPRVHALVEADIREWRALITNEVTQTLHAAILSHLPDLVHQIHTGSVADTVTEIVTDTNKEPIISRPSVTDTNGNVADTEAQGEVSTAAAEPASESERGGCLWCGMTIVTKEDEIRHREQCRAARGEAPSPAQYMEAVRGQGAPAPAPASRIPRRRKR